MTVRNVGTSSVAQPVVFDLYVNQQWAIDRTGHDGSFPTDLVVGANSGTYSWDDFDEITLPQHLSGTRPEGVPAGMGTDDGIYLWRDPNDQGLWTLAMTANDPFPRLPGSSSVLPPQNTVAQFDIYTLDGFPEIHDVTAKGMENADKANVLGDGTLEVLFQRDTSVSTDMDTVQFRFDESEWLTVTTATDTVTTNITPGGTRTLDFEIALSPNITEHYEPILTLYAEDNAGFVGLTDFRLEASGPRLELNALGFETLDGDTAKIEPRFHVYTAADIDSAAFRITSAHANLTVIDDVISTGKIFVDKTIGPLRFTTTASSTEPQLDMSATLFFTRGAAGDSLRLEWDGLEFDPPATVTGAHVHSFESSFWTIQWEPLSGAAGYNVYRYLEPLPNVIARVNGRVIRDVTKFDYGEVGGVGGRAQYFYVTAVDSSGNEGTETAAVPAPAMYRQHPGWPKYLPRGTATGSPLAVDLDGNGAVEIVAAADKVYAWNIDGTPYGTTDVLFDPGDPLASFATPLAAGDLDDDGDVEIVACSLDSAYVINEDGSVLLRERVSPLLAPPVVANIDGDKDGTLEVLVTGSGSSTKHIYAWDDAGASFFSGTGGKFADIERYSYGALSVANLDEDPDLEVIHAPDGPGSNDAIIKVFKAEDVSPADGRADLLWTFNTRLHTRVWKPAIGDVDGDGDVEIVIAQGHGIAGESQILILRPGTADTLELEHALTDLPVGIGADAGPPVALGNLDSDENLEILVGGSRMTNTSDGTKAALFVVQAYPDTAYVERCDLFAYKPFIKWYSNSNNDQSATHSSALIANIDNDSATEIMVGSDAFAVHFLEWDPAESTCVADQFSATLPAVPFVMLEGEVRGSPQIGEFTYGTHYDTNLDMLVQDLGGRISLFDLASTGGTVQWSGFGNDLQNTGRYGSASLTGPSGDEAVLDAIRLLQNRPNPFNPRTTIGYAIGEEQHVQLRIFDVGGRQVTTLVDSVQRPGVHAVPWDGTDDAGRSLGSGVFFYELRVGGVRHTKKLLLLR